MNEETTEIARTLAAHERWEWREGMRASCGAIYCMADDITGEELWYEPDGCGVFNDARVTRIWPAHRAHYAPNINDDATAGGLLSMMPGRYSAMRSSGGMITIRTRAGSSGPCPTLGHACALALLAIWEAE